MKKIQLRIPALGAKIYTIIVPDLSEKTNTKAQIILKLLSILNLIILFTYFFILPFFPNLPVSETIIFQAFINFTLILLSFYIFVIFISRQIFIDPSNFIFVLIFALLTTFSSVFTTSYGVINTFGKFNFRGIAGLTVMLLVAFFYLINVYIKDEIIFRRIIRIFLLGAILSFIILVLNSFTQPSNYLKENLLFILVFIPLFIINISYSKNKSILFVLLIIIITVIILNINIITNDFRLMFFLITTMLISFLPIYLLFVINKKDFIKVKLQNIIKKDNQRNIIQDLLFTLFILLPFILIVINIILLGITLYQKNTSISQAFSIILERYINSIKSLTNNNAFNFSMINQVIFGQGGDKYSSNYSLIANIIGTQGILSLFAYILIWVYAISRSLKLFFKTINQKDKDYKLIFGLNLIILFVPIISLFVYPGLFLIILWWFCFALISSYENFTKDKLITVPKEKITNFIIKGINFRGRSLGRLGYYIRYLIGGLIIIICFLSIIGLNQYIK